MTEQQKALMELMTTYDDKRKQWINEFGNDDNFNDWFTTQVKGKFCRFTRYTIPDEIKKYITVAIRLEVIDPLELYVLGVDCGRDLGKLCKTICYYAYQSIHTQPEQHKTLSPMYDKIYAQYKDGYAWEDIEIDE